MAKEGGPVLGKKAEGRRLEDSRAGGEMMCVDKRVDLYYTDAVFGHR